MRGLRGNFDTIKEKIQILMETEPGYQLEVGRKREEMVARALEELQREGLIRGFVYSGKLSLADVMKGVDFYIVYVSEVYKVCRIDATGRNGIEKKKNHHPENQVISIDLEETQESVRGKILRAIAAQERRLS